MSWATDINLRWGAFAWSPERIGAVSITKPKNCI
jgi:hypothetical protein